MVRRKRRLWLMAAWVLLSACSLDTQPALRIGANIWPGYEPMHLARGQGWYESKQIKLIDFPSAVEVIRAYRNGVIDVAALTADEVLEIAATEPGKHKIILVADFSNGADCILAQPSYTKFTELKGRRVGVESNALGGYVLLRALQLHGMSIQDIQPVSLPLDQHVSAFEAGIVDAVVTFEPNRSTLLASGALEVFTSKEIPGEVIDVIVTRVELLDTRRTALLHFVNGWFKGLSYLQRQPQEAAKYIAVHEHTTPETFLASLQGLELIDRERNRRLLGGGPESIDKALARLAQVMRDSGLLKTAVDVRDLPAKYFVEQATP